MYLNYLTKTVDGLSNSIEPRVCIAAQYRQDHQLVLLVLEILNDLVNRYAMVARVGGKGRGRKHCRQSNFLRMARFVHALEHDHGPIRHASSVEQKGVLVKCLVQNTHLDAGDLRLR